MGECVINLGFLTRKKVIEIQLECDIFLLFIWNGEERQGVLTGKLYDAMLLKKNVLAIVNGQKADSEMKERIEGCRLGFCCEEAVKEDFNKMKQWIKSQYEEKINIGELKPSYTNNYKKYNYIYLSRCMERLMENCCKKGKG